MRALAVVSVSSGSVLASFDAAALTPTVVWQKSGANTGNACRFSADGNALLIAVPTGFELRRAVDGSLLSTVTLPSASLAYTAFSLSPDQQTLALALFNNAVGTIELWRVSNGTLTRSITTDAVRSMKQIDVSSGGVVATVERFAYGGGGFLRVHRMSDGALLKKLGPVVRNSTPQGLGFAHNGSYLAVSDNFSVDGISLLRTTDYGAARTIGAGTFASLFAWSPDSASLWTANMQQIRVSDGAVLQTMPLVGGTVPSWPTPDNRFFLAWQLINNTATNTFSFVRTTDGLPQLTYTLASGTVVWSEQVNALDTLFTYEICPSNCTVYVAKMPTL
jgi:hypothetical protein